MRRGRSQGVEAPGQDSFLDIVANLVGIMIILVMVVGVRAKDALLEAAPAATEAEAPDQAAERQRWESEYAALQDAEQRLLQDIQRVDEDLKRQDVDFEYRRQERHRALLLVRAAEQAIAERRNLLDASQQQQFDAQQKLRAERAQLDELQRGIQSVRAATHEVDIIEHLPTPMAKTVFGDELHFELRQGRLSHIPWKDLIAELEQAAPRHVWRLNELQEFTDTLGPLGGYWLKYTLARVEQNVETRVGMAVRRGVELDHFVILPVSESLGEPLEAALRDGSDLVNRLRQHRPENTTITVWTYPDSFHQFRLLKKFLFERGFLTASRPLPADQPIGGSPRGSRSAAQ